MRVGGGVREGEGESESESADDIESHTPQILMSVSVDVQAPLGDLLSKMSPDTLPAVYPVWRYSCSAVMYSPWFLLMVAGSK